jgi:hypothetical protein
MRDSTQTKLKDIGDKQSVNSRVFGVQKIGFSSHLAEFLWRYENKGKNLFVEFLCDVKKIYSEF